MNKQNIIIGLSIAVLLILNFTVKPYLHRNDAIQIIETVLSYWKSGDLALAMSYWEKEIDSPPVYGLIAYEIKEGEISKKGHVRSARITASLEFPPGNLFPSGKSWIFELNKTRYGWKITNFRLLEN